MLDEKIMKGLICKIYAELQTIARPSDQKRRARDITMDVVRPFVFTWGNELTEKFSKPKISRTPVQYAALYIEM